MLLKAPATPQNESQCLTKHRKRTGDYNNEVEVGILNILIINADIEIPRREDKLS